MKSSAIKIIKSYLNKKDVNNLKKILTPRNIAISISLLIVIGIFFYLLRPVFFDYDLKKDIFQKKVDNYLNVRSDIQGQISYYFFPRPRIVVEKLKLNFSNSRTKPITVEKSSFLISIFKLNSLEQIQIKKTYISNQSIKISPEQLKNYLYYFEQSYVENFILKNCEILFSDRKDNDIPIKNFNLKNTFKKNNKKVSVKGIFSQNKFKINFSSEKNKEKYLDFIFPNLNTYLKIIYDKDSSLDKASGKLKLKVLDNIFIINFDRDEIYKITDSFFRNKFLNSKLDGSINFKENFFFDLNLMVNQINLRKLFLYYDSVADIKNPRYINISKKINGKVNIVSKRTDSFIGKIEDTSLIMYFENGDLKIKNGSSSIGNNSKVKFNFSLLGKGKDQKINFFINFTSEKAKKLLKKFNIDAEEEDLSFNAFGKINVIKKKIKFENLFANKQKIPAQDIKSIENLFNEYVIKNNVWDFLDFFKIKKFAQEINKSLE